MFIANERQLILIEPQRNSVWAARYSLAEISLARRRLRLGQQDAPAGCSSASVKSQSGRLYYDFYFRRL